MAIYVPLKLVVVYRILVSKSRHSVAPNAGMAALVAPASFYTLIHLSVGKPGGDAVGTALFVDSTVFFWITVGMLWVRRDLWTKAFDPSYVAFTFPLASTASAAVLAAQRLPAVAGATARVWAL